MRSSLSLVLLVVLPLLLSTGFFVLPASVSAQSSQSSYPIIRNISANVSATRWFSTNNVDRLYWTTYSLIHVADLTTSPPTSLSPINITNDPAHFQLNPSLNAGNVRADRVGQVHVYAFWNALGGIVTIDPRTEKWVRFVRNNATDSLVSFDVSADGQRYVVSRYLSPNINVMSAIDGSTLFTLPQSTSLGSPVVFNNANGRILVATNTLVARNNVVREYSSTGQLLRIRGPSGGFAVSALQILEMDDTLVLFDGSVSFVSTNNELTKTDVTGMYFLNALAVDNRGNVTVYDVIREGSRASWTGFITISRWRTAPLSCTGEDARVGDGEDGGVKWTGGMIAILVMGIVFVVAMPLAVWVLVRLFLRSLHTFSTSASGDGADRESLEAGLLR